MKHPPLQIPWLIGEKKWVHWIIHVYFRLVFLLVQYPNKLTPIFKFNIIFSLSWGGFLTSSCAFFFFFFCVGFGIRRWCSSVSLSGPVPFWDIVPRFKLAIRGLASPVWGHVPLVVVFQQPKCLRDNPTTLMRLFTCLDD